jgi:hypothetical protein
MVATIGRGIVESWTLNEAGILPDGERQEKRLPNSVGVRPAFVRFCWGQACIRAYFGLTLCGIRRNAGLTPSALYRPFILVGCRAKKALARLFYFHVEITRRALAEASLRRRSISWEYQLFMV